MKTKKINGETYYNYRYFWVLDTCDTNIDDVMFMKFGTDSKCDKDNWEVQDDEFVLYKDENSLLISNGDKERIFYYSDHETIPVDIWNILKVYSIK